MNAELYNRKSDGVMNKAFVSYVRLNGNVFLKSISVTELIRTMASTEETDVKNRFNELADILDKIGKDA